MRRKTAEGVAGLGPRRCLARIVRRVLAAAGLGLATLAAPPAALAAAGAHGASGGEAGALVEIGGGKVGAAKVVVGKSRTLRTSRPFVDLVVGDAEIADVMPLDDRSLYVLGRRIGTTSVSVYDGAKALIGVLEVEVAYNAPRIAAELDRAVPGEEARVGSVNGRTVLDGTVPDAVAAARAVETARQYGPEVVNRLKVRGPQQVSLEVRFVEVARNDSKEAGVRWRLGDATRGGANSGASIGLSSLLSGATPFGAAVGKVLSRGVRADVLIQALEERGLARRLAEPNLVAMSGEKASFLAGGEYPIPVSGDLGRVTVDYKRYGVMLTFLPTVLADGLINLRIEPEVSQLDFTNQVQTGTVAVPAMIVRRASTVVELRDGQSFAIGGLLQTTNQTTQEQLPWLGDVPILGALARSTSFEKKETDLAIIVTPRLVRPARPGERLRTPLDDALPANDAERFLVGRLETTPAQVRGGERPPARGHIIE